MIGFVYFISVPGRIKIGFATLPESRIKQIGRYTECEPTLIAKIEGDVPFERAIHSHLAAHRLRGEWFADNEEVRATIKHLVAKGPAAIGHRTFIFRHRAYPNPCSPERPGHEILQDLAKRVFPEDPCGGLAESFEVSRERCQAWLDGAESLPKIYANALGGLIIQWMQPRAHDLPRHSVRAQKKERQANCP